MASRVGHEGDTAAAQVRAAFALALGREPDEAEERACVELVKSRSLTELCRALLNVNEFIYVD